MTFSVLNVICIIIICGIIFIPLGFYIRDTFYRMKIFFRIAPKLRSNLENRGSFKKFLENE